MQVSLRKSVLRNLTKLAFSATNSPVAVPSILIMSLVFLLLPGIGAAQLPDFQLPEQARQFVEAASQLSTPVYLQLVYERFGYDPRTGTRLPVSSESSYTEPARPIPSGSLEATLAGALYTVQVSEGSGLDAETTMTAVNGIGGDRHDYTVIGYMRYLNGIWSDNVAATKTGDGYWTYTQLPLLSSNYNNAADPVVASNPYSSGIRPKRVYLVGLNTGAGRQAIIACYSDSGGMTWSQPVLIKENVTAPWYLDKPDVEVSWHDGTLGIVYVAYQNLQVPGNPYATEIYVTRSESGGEPGTWTNPIKVITGRVSNPQVSVNSNTGRVYCSWIDIDQDRLCFSFSDNRGQSWSAVETAATGPMKTNENPSVDGGLLNCRTIHQMRFDASNNQVIMVWHEGEYQATGQHTGSTIQNTLIDIYADFLAAGIRAGDFVRNKYTDTHWLVSRVVDAHTLELGSEGSWKSKPWDLNFHTGNSYIVKAKGTDICFVRKTAYGWQPKVKLNVQVVRDQFQPSADYSNNEILVGYYDRYDDPNNTQFKARWVKIDAAGTRISDGVFADSFQSPLQYDFIGDYTDTFYWPYAVSGSDPWGPRWHFVFTGKKPPSTEYKVWAGAVN